MDFADNNNEVMAAFISKKQSVLILLIGLCTAAGVILLLCNFSLETRMGFFYDFLLKKRPAPPVSNEIVLIQTGDFAEGGDVFDVLMGLSEFKASALVILAPILGVSSDRSLTDEEIRQRLDDEYSLLARNIRSLFDAIKMGSVQPAEAQFYVDNLIGLADRGKDRLNIFFLRNVEPEAMLSARIDGVFDNVLEADDLRSKTPEGSPWYSRPRLDGDGTLRRVAPLLPTAQGFGSRTGAYTEHIVYRALKPRWTHTGIEDIDYRHVLVAGDFSFPLDYSGNILVEKPHEGDSFRIIDIEQFRSYTEADLSFRRMLKYAESLGAYSNLRPEQIPLYLYDHTVSLQDDLLKNPSPEKHIEWLHARREYWRYLEEFLNGDSESRLLGYYDELIISERYLPSSVARLRQLREDFVLLFARMREAHRELIDMRAELETALNSSFCIMGPPYGESHVVEASALLANTLLTGRYVCAARKPLVVLCSFAAVFLLLFLVHALRPVVVLICGTSASIVCAAGFGWAFILTGYWMYPQIPALACIAGTVAMFFTAFVIRLRAVRRFRLAYRGIVNKKCLRQLIKTGEPSPQRIQTAAAAVVAVKLSGLLIREDKDDPVHAAQAAADFREAVRQNFLKAGAALIGCEGDTVLVCFGSPPERIYLDRTKSETGYGDEPGSHGNHPVIRAAGFIIELIRTAPAPWCFGIDYGDCAFSWSKESGYIANGRPVVRARILASLAPKYKARILITNAVREKVDRPARKLHFLGGTSGSARDIFYELSLSPEP
jgi:class 3 adenylate cyclase